MQRTDVSLFATFSAGVASLLALAMSPNAAVAADSGHNDTALIKALPQATPIK
jgi:hypothetical protein